jgi:hypothetical protein
VGTMSELRPGRDTTLPSAQHIGTGHTPLVATTRDTYTGNSNSSFSLPGSRDADDEYSPPTNASSEGDSSLDQRSAAESSLQSRPVHGKIACQACVSGTSASHGDV